MFQTASGVTIPFPEKIKEEYQMYETSILFNISFEKLKPLIYKVIEQLSEPLFFVLEMPLSQQEETEFRLDETSPFHKNVCYLDGQSKEQIMNILSLYGELLLNDGISQFAIYSHATYDGIYIQKYKIARIYSPAPTAYIELLESFGITKTENIFTVWDTFTHETPGQTQRIEIDGKNISDVYDELAKNGMYIAKVVAD